MNKKFSQRLREQLDKKNIKPAELSRMTGLSEPLISYYLNDKTEPKNDKILIIAEALNITPLELMGIEDSSSDKIVDGVNMSKAQFALYGETKDLSDEELEEVASFINYVKQKREK